MTHYNRFLFCSAWLLCGPPTHQTLLFIKGRPSQSLSVLISISRGECLVSSDPYCCRHVADRKDNFVTLELNRSRVGRDMRNISSNPFELQKRRSFRRQGNPSLPWKLQTNSERFMALQEIVSSYHVSKHYFLILRYIGHLFVQQRSSTPETSETCAHQLRPSLYWHVSTVINVGPPLFVRQILTLDCVRA